MRTQRRNQQKMYYALYDKEIPIYATDEQGNIIYDSYTTEEGEIITYPHEIERVSGYTKPEEFMGNIAMSGGEAEAVEFGIDLSQYSAVLITEKDLLPISETSRIWFESEPVYNADGTVNGDKADYMVVAVKPSLNYTKYLLNKIVK